MGDHLEQSDHEMLVFSIVGEVRKDTSRISTLDFGLFRTLIDGVPWESVLEDKGVQKARHALKRNC